MNFNFFLALVVAFLSSFVVGKQCVDLTIPVNISARNGLFDIAKITSDLDVTHFVQNMTSLAGNFTQLSLLDYQTVTGAFEIAATFCKPDYLTASTTTHYPTIQVLTHGIGFDKSYWDLPFNSPNYSYVDVAAGEFGYCTLAIDRLGIGNSSIAEPLNVIQAPATMSAMYEINKMIRVGTLPGLRGVTFNKVVNVGHSFGAALSYALAATHPTATDGLVLTGFSTAPNNLALTLTAWSSKIASLNQPLRFGNVSYAAVQAALAAVNNTSVDNTLQKSPPDLASLQSAINTQCLAAIANPPALPHAQDLPNGYITWNGIEANQYGFFYPGHFDPEILAYAESTKQPYTLGEVLTLPCVPESAGAFAGPVQMITGNQDAPYCGGDCSATLRANASVPAWAYKAAFPAARVFEAYIQPNTGHAINMHYNATEVYYMIQNFLVVNGLEP